MEPIRTSSSFVSPDAPTANSPKLILPAAHSCICQTAPETAQAVSLTPGYVPGETLPLAEQAGSALCDISLMNRVGRVLRDFAAERAPTDDEVRQHIRDCTFLMESAYGRFQAWGTVADREEAYLWMCRRDEALRSLSPAWKAARETEIQQAIGIDFFKDQADRDRSAGGRA